MRYIGLLASIGVMLACGMAVGEFGTGAILYSALFFAGGVLMGLSFEL